MPRFFIDFKPTDTATLTGENASHISKSLRMKIGDEITLCDGENFDYLGTISDISADNVCVTINSKVQSVSEPDVYIHLFQAMPKGDKFELIIQKAVELGVSEITPILTSRCISRPDDKSMKKKLERYNKIALEASKQSGRGKLVTVNPMLSFEKALEKAKSYDLPMFLYEVGGCGIKKVLNETPYKSVSMIIGSEGGFSPTEAEQAKDAGCVTTYLGKRILRCETAPLCAISSVMFHSGNLE